VVFLLRYKKVVAKVRERKKSRKQAIITLVSLLIIFLFFSIYSIVEYKSYHVSYSDLKCEQLTFEKYEKISGYRKITYEFHFEEYNGVFLVDSIAQKKLNKTSLNKLSEGDTVKVYYKNKKDFFRNYSFEICEITYKNKTILSLKDYKTVNQNNQLLGIIICPICCLIFLVLIYWVRRYMN
jgi:predicted permease